MSNALKIRTTNDKAKAIITTLILTTRKKAKQAKELTKDHAQNIKTAWNMEIK